MPFNKRATLRVEASYPPPSPSPPSPAFPPKFPTRSVATNPRLILFRTSPFNSAELMRWCAYIIEVFHSLRLTPSGRSASAFISQKFSACSPQSRGGNTTQKTYTHR